MLLSVSLTLAITIVHVALQSDGAAVSCTGEIRQVPIHTLLGFIVTNARSYYGT